ncbi:TPA: hypothetical protein DCZ16_02945 [Candidatus Peregrinibacteria bacterium]|nr:hypothetical protein [Candidatus Peregrinibacteria bacterium]
MESTGKLYWFKGRTSAARRFDLKTEVISDINSFVEVTAFDKKSRSSNMRLCRAIRAFLFSNEL